MSHFPLRPAVGARVLLGLFISWQLFFLLAANLLPLLPHGGPEEGELSDSRCPPQLADSKGPVQEAVNRVAALTDCWTRWTGQTQAWWLFAPDVPRQATFPAVELRWDNAGGLPEAPGHEPVRLRCLSEPDDRQAYWRPPGSLDRLFHYELRLGLLFLGWDRQSLQAYPDLWRQAVAERVRRQWRSIRAYLRWCVQQFGRAHPELPPPRQAILSIRIYPTAPPGHDPVEQPLARWQPGAAERPGCLPVEMCDPVTGRFVPLPRKD